MSETQSCDAPSGRFSALVLIDRLITLAEQADRAGMEEAAGDLIALVYTVEGANRRRRPASLSACTALGERLSAQHPRLNRP